MKKKSIFITGIVLALLVFVGCSEPTLNLPKYVASADIKQNGVFLEGQPFDASKFSVTVIYTDGSKEELTGVNVQLDPSANGDVSNGVAITAEAGVNSKGGVFTAKGTVVAYAIDSLTVTAPTSITTATSGNGAVVNEAKASDFTVVANYRDSQGAKTLPLVANADYSVEVKLNQALSADKPNGTARAEVTLKFGDNKNPAGYQVAGINVTYSENVTPGDYSDYEWTGNIVYAQVPASSTVKYFTSGEFDGDKMVEVYRVYTPAGETTSYTAYYLEKIDSGLEFTLTTPLTGEGNENRFAATGETAAFTMTYTYVKDEDAAYGLKTVLDSSESDPAFVLGSIEGVKENADGKLVSITEGSTWYAASTNNAMSIKNIKADYIKSLKAESLMTAPYLEGWQASNTQFKVTATYASGVTAVLESDDYTVDNTALKAGQTSVKIELAGNALTTAEKYGTAPETTGAVKVQKEDYPTRITAAWKDSQPSTAGVKLDKDSFTFTVTWASNTTYTEENPAPDVTYSVSPSETKVGENKIVITWNCNGVSGTATGIGDFTIGE